MLHLLIFGTTALRLYWQVVWQCWSLIKLYSELVLSTLWMNLVQRAALRSSRVVRPVVEGGARMKFQAGLLQERAFGPSPGRWRGRFANCRACALNNRVYAEKSCPR